MAPFVRKFDYLLEDWGSRGGQHQITTQFILEVRRSIGGQSRLIFFAILIIRCFSPGKRSFGLKEKVKHLKNHLKLWNMSNFCSLDMQAKEDVKKTNNLDELATTSEREVCKKLMEV